MATENVTGEKRFNSETTELEARKGGKKVFALAPTGDYEIKLVGDKARVEAPSQANPGGTPYVSVPFELLGTDDNGKTIKMFARFFITNDLNPEKPESKWVATKARNSVNALAKALGVPLEVSLMDFSAANGTTREILNPQEVVQWLKQNDGMTVKAHIKQEKGGEYQSGGETKTRPDANTIGYFINN